MTCPKLAKTWMRGDRPSVCDARPLRSLRRGRTPMKVRQIEGGNDSAKAEPGISGRPTNCGLRTLGSGGAHEN
jgi:hypothetical protein